MMTAVAAMMTAVAAGTKVTTIATGPKSVVVRRAQLKLIGKGQTAEQ